MDDIPPDEEIESGKDEVVLLRFSRSWPHSIVEWTRRRRNIGSQSFPLESGTVKSDANPPDWDALRTQALAEAGAGGDQAASGLEPTKTPSLWARITGRG